MDLMQMIQQSISQLTATTDARTQALQRQAATINAEADKLQTLGTRAVVLDRAAAETASQAAAQKANTDFQVNSSIQRIDDLYGVDPDQNNSVIQTRIAEYTAAEESRKLARKEYDALAQTSLLENPVGYIINQLKLPSVAARHNAIVDVRDAAIRDIRTRQELAAAQKSVQIPNVANELKATALLQANADRQKAEAEVIRREADLGSKIAGIRMQAFQLGDKALDVKAGYADQLLRYATLQEQREATAEAREARLAALNASLKDRETRAAAIAGLNGRLGTVSNFLGIPPQAAPTVEGLDRLGNQKAQNDWYKMAATGTLGGSVSESVDNLETYGNLAGMQQQNPLAFQGYQGIKAALGSYRATAQMQARANPQLQEVIKKRETLNAYVSNEYLTELEMSATSMAPEGARLADSRYDTLFNPYRVNHKIMLSGNPPIPLNNVMLTALNAASVGREAQIASMPNLPAEVEVNALQGVIKSIVNGVIGVDEAAQQITQYYTAGMRSNLDAYQYTNFGIPAQSSYVIRLPAQSLLGDPIMFNAANFASVKAALAKVARANMSTLPPGFTGIPSPVRPPLPGQ
jgi:hypothetical protein